MGNFLLDALVVIITTGQKARVIGFREVEDELVLGYRKPLVMQIKCTWQDGEETFECYFYEYDLKLISVENKPKQPPRYRNVRDSIWDRGRISIWK